MSNSLERFYDSRQLQRFDNPEGINQYTKGKGGAAELRADGTRAPNSAAVSKTVQEATGMSKHVTPGISRNYRGQAVPSSAQMSGVKVSKRLDGSLDVRLFTPHGRTGDSPARSQQLRDAHNVKMDSAVKALSAKGFRAKRNPQQNDGIDVD